MHVLLAEQKVQVHELIQNTIQHIIMVQLKTNVCKVFSSTTTTLMTEYARIRRNLRIITNYPSRKPVQYRVHTVEYEGVFTMAVTILWVYVQQASLVLSINET